MNTTLYMVRPNAGRPSKDFAWTELIRHSDLVVEDDYDENDGLLAQLRDGTTFTGCQKRHNAKKWHCKMYIGGRQRIIGYGTLYQCLKLYDYALVFFDKYRPRRDQWGFRQFNFSEEDAKSDMLREPAIESYFQSLEKHLLFIGALMSPGDKSAAQRESKKKAQKTWQKKQTIVYQVKSYIDDLGQELIRLNSEVAANNTEIIRLNTKLDTIIKLVQPKPV